MSYSGDHIIQRHPKAFPVVAPPPLHHAQPRPCGHHQTHSPAQHHLQYTDVSPCPTVPVAMCVSSSSTHIHYAQHDHVTHCFCHTDSHASFSRTIFTPTSMLVRRTTNRYQVDDVAVTFQFSCSPAKRYAYRGGRNVAAVVVTAHTHTRGSQNRFRLMSPSLWALDQSASSGEPIPAADQGVERALV